MVGEACSAANVVLLSFPPVHHAFFVKDAKHFYAQPWVENTGVIVATFSMQQLCCKDRVLVWAALLLTMVIRKEMLHLPNPSPRPASIKNTRVIFHIGHGLFSTAYISAHK